ncbi:MAG: hypothetical protein Q4E45_11870 [Eubacteriales bacterium]|nr:hypothetical protein [Eubacteriales bacterium]
MWREFWATAAAEIKALGVRAFVYGPEAHLVLPILYGAVFFVVLFIGTRGGE